LVKLKLEETPTSYAEWRAEDWLLGIRYWGLETEDFAMQKSALSPFFRIIVLQNINNHGKD
jgi:hypothetical protein